MFTPFAVPAGVEQASPYAALALILVAGAAICAALDGWPARTALWVGLAGCLTGIGWLTIGETVAASNPGRTTVNLTVFQEIARAWETGSPHAWLNVIGNVAMFAPLGAILAALVNRGPLARVVMATVLAAGLSAAIEVFQFGWGRVADVDDVLLNTAGALGGALVVAAVVWVKGRVSGRRGRGVAV